MVGGSDAVADFNPSWNLNVPLTALAGCDDGRSSDLSNETFEKLTPALTGLVNTGVSALRKSVYAAGGVMGVETSPSRRSGSDRDERASP